MTSSSILCVGALPAGVSAHHMCAWSLWRPEEDFSYPGTRVSDGYETPRMCLDSLESLEEKPVFLNPEPSLQPDMGSTRKDKQS